MKKFAVAVLSMGLLGALSAAQAATVTVDAGTYTFSYDDSFLAGSSFSSSANTFTFSGLSYLAAALGGVQETNMSGGTFNGYANVGYPIVITPKAGYQITGLTELVSGNYSASVKDSGTLAAASGGLVSYWVYQNGVTPLGQNTPNQVFSVTAGQESVGGSYTASGSLDFTPVILAQHLAPGAIVLSSLSLTASAFAFGTGSGALASLNLYQIGVQTAAVPEPEVLALVLAGLGVVGMRLGRRNQR